MAGGQSGNSRRDAQDADVIVIGAGAAGLSCSLGLAHRGVKVLLVDKSATPGGTFMLANGTFSAANTRLSRALGTDDAPRLHLADAVRIGRGRNNVPLLTKIVENAGPTLDWLLDMGLRLKSQEPRLAAEHELMTIARTYDTDNRAKSYLAVLRPAVDAEVTQGHIVLKLRTRLVGLVRERNGRVAGAEVQDSKGVTSAIFAPFTILAAGGYGGDRGTVAKYHPGFENAVTICGAFADGSAIAIAQDSGAALVNMDLMRVFPGALSGLSNAWRAMPPPNYLVKMGATDIVGPIWVSSDGRRVLNEDTAKQQQIEDVLARSSDKTLFVLFDSKTREAFAVPPVPAWDWETFEVEARSIVDKHVVASNSITELAVRAGIHPDNLAETIARWNALAQLARDPDFGRESTIPLDRPPFYVMITKGCIGLTFGGLRVNDDFQVVSNEGAAVPGLYAIGEALGMGQFMGDGLVSGLGNAMCLTSGRIVGERLAAQVRGQG